MYEVFPIAAGALIGIAVAGSRLRIPSARVAGCLGLAVLVGVAVSFASGEWRNGVIYPLWDAFQAACAFCLSLAIGVRWLGRRSRGEEG